MTARTILLTGATDGIGLALARIYHAQGERLILVGRRALDTLDPALFTPQRYCRVDLALPYCAGIVEQFLKTRDIQSIDLLIHNAALGYYGATATQPAHSIHERVAVNLRAPVALTHALLPHLRQSGNVATEGKQPGQGKIVFISSVVSALPCPDYAVYGATKAALDGFARSLRVELRGSIGVQVIYPGGTRTGMHIKSGVPPHMLRLERFPSAEQVAAQIARAIDSSQESVTIGIGNRLLQLAGRHTATLTDWLLRRRYQ
jgi:short-subunit dehydrogenase